MGAPIGRGVASTGSVSATALISIGLLIILVSWSIARLGRREVWRSVVLR